MLLNLGSWELLGGIGLSEIVLTRAWYIWWKKRQYTHREELQPTHRSAMLIGVLATNYWRLKKKKKERTQQKWTCH
jgi:hypothetical protein